MTRFEAATRPHFPKQAAGAHRPAAGRAPTQALPCQGAAAQLAAVHRTLRRGPDLPHAVGDAPAPTKARAANRTGLPDRLRAGIESLSGFGMDDVKVHYGSSKPAQLQALAYTQGTDIHVAPGQEKHLPHEAWHVVQQKQGRVKPTAQFKDARINEDHGLEREADAMGMQAARGVSPAAAGAAPREAKSSAGGEVHQLARAPREQRASVRAQRGAQSRYRRPLYPAAQMPLDVQELANTLNARYRAAGQQPGLPRHFVYLATQRGRVVYVGITDNVEARQAEHGDRFHLIRLNRPRLTRIQVRAIEQFAINRFRRDPGNQNIANSIAVHHPYYRDALRFGRAFLRWILERMDYLRV